MNTFLAKINEFYKKINSDKLRVLAYHDVPNSQAFDKQISYLKAHYNVIDILTLKAHLIEGVRLPKDAVLITFDDGDYTVLENGIVVLKKHNLPSVLFVLTDLIDSQKAFWWKQVEENAKMNGESFEEGRKKVNELKVIPNTEREGYLQKLQPVSAKQLSYSELIELQKSGMFIGNHTHTHPMIDKCRDEEIINEFNLSKKRFEKWDLSGYPIFAYPNGNWDANSEKILKKMDVELAFLFDHKINKKKINSLRISRLRVNTYSPLNEFALKVSGLHAVLMHSGLTRLLKK